MNVVQEVIQFFKKHEIPIIQFGHNETTDFLADQIVEDNNVDVYGKVLVSSSSHLLDADFNIFYGTVEEMNTHKTNFKYHKMYHESRTGINVGVFSNSRESLPDIPLEYPKEQVMLESFDNYGWGNIIRNMYVLENQHNVPCVLKRTERLKYLIRPSTYLLNRTIESDITYEYCSNKHKIYDREPSLEVLKKQLTFDPCVKYTYNCEGFRTCPFNAVHIRFGDQFHLQWKDKQPYIRMDDTWSTHKAIRDAIDQINSLIEVRVFSDHPMYGGEHSNTTLRQKEIQDWFDLVHSENIYTFRGKDGSLSTFAVSAAFYGKKPLHVFDIYKSPVSVDIIDPKIELFKI